MTTQKKKAPPSPEREALVDRIISMITTAEGRGELDCGLDDLDPGDEGYSSEVDQNLRGQLERDQIVARWDTEAGDGIMLRIHIWRALISMIDVDSRVGLTGGGGHPENVARASRTFECLADVAALATRILEAEAVPVSKELAS